VLTGVAVANFAQHVNEGPRVLLFALARKATGLDRYPTIHELRRGLALVPTAEGTPSRLPECCLIIWIEASIGAGTHHDIALLFRDADGDELHRADRPGLEFKKAADGYPLYLLYVIPLTGSKLPAFGDYTIELLVDGRKLAETPLYLGRADPEGNDVS